MKNVGRRFDAHNFLMAGEATTATVPPSLVSAAKSGRSPKRNRKEIALVSKSTAPGVHFSAASGTAHKLGIGFAPLRHDSPQGSYWQPLLCIWLFI